MTNRPRYWIRAIVGDDIVARARSNAPGPKPEAQSQKPAGAVDAAFSKRSGAAPFTTASWRTRPARAHDRAGGSSAGVRRNSSDPAAGYRDRLPARPDGLRRPLRQQRLAAGAAEAAHAPHVGQRRAREPGHDGAARRHGHSGLHGGERGQIHGSIVEMRYRRPHRARGDVPRCWPSGRRRDTASRLRPDARRQRRTRSRLQRRRAPNVDRALRSAPARRSRSPARHRRWPACSTTT